MIYITDHQALSVNEFKFFGEYDDSEFTVVIELHKTDSGMEYKIENNLGLSAVVSKGYDPDIAERVFTLIQRSEFKRKQAPPVISVTSKTFGKGWRMAIAKKMVR